LYLIDEPEKEGLFKEKNTEAFFEGYAKSDSIYGN
jgi:hypothetical protein